MNKESIMLEFYRTNLANVIDQRDIASLKKLIAKYERKLEKRGLGSR